MKKLAAILFVLPLMLVLASCGGEDLQPRVDELEERLGPPPCGALDIPELPGSDSYSADSGSTG